MEKKIIAHATIWQQGKTRVYVNDGEENGKHKTPHVHVEYEKEDVCSVGIKDGKVLSGRLPSEIRKWFKKFITLFKEEILEMLKTKKYYRLDRVDEYAKHNKNIKSSEDDFDPVEYAKLKGKLIDTVIQVSTYVLRIWFKNGSVKDFNLEAVIHSDHYRPLFQPMIDDPSIISNFKISDSGMIIYWDDIMDFDAEWLYENAKDVIQL